MSAMVSFFPLPDAGEPLLGESDGLLQPAIIARLAAARTVRNLFMPYLFAGCLPADFAVGPGAWPAISESPNWTARESAAVRPTPPPLRVAGGHEPDRCSTLQSPPRRATSHAPTRRRRRY